jgi:transcriptional regulator with XRE-family HTH domain
MEFGERVRILREKRKLKQLDLANAMQVSPQAVSKWERNENYPDIVTLLKLASILNVTTDYLLGATETRPGVFEATVFCTGVKRFAQRSTAMNSRDVADWMNVVFHHLTEGCLKFDGVPVKYVGDGFLCFFSGARHADRALKAAVHAKTVIRDDDLVVSLHAGDIYLGAIGHPDYAQTDIIGETVNLAFLLLDVIGQHCSDGIGVTDAVKKRLKGAYALTHTHPARIDRLGIQTGVSNVAWTAG